MNFLHPGIALAAVAAIAIPIVIHLLFRRRRVPVDWAAMELLREAVRRTNRRLRFEQWLVLALRALAVLLLGLGISVPFIGGGVLGEDARTWIVVVDDGALGALRTGAEDELARVRAEALRLVSERGARDSVGIVLASTPPRLVLDPTADGARIERELGSIVPSESPSDLRGALRIARERLASADAGPRAPGRIVLASALRAGSFGSAAEADGAAKNAVDADSAAGSPEQVVEIVALEPARDAPTDVSVASIDARIAPSGSAASVRVGLSRQGASLEAGRTDVRVSGDGFVDPPARTVEWERGESEASIEFQLTPGAAATTSRAGARRSAIEVRLDDDPLRPGNSAWTVIDARNEVEVGVVGRRGTLDLSDIDKVPASLWVSRALSPAVGSGMRLRDIDPSACDARALAGVDAVVVARPDLLPKQACDVLGEFVRAGGIVAVMPAGDSRAQSWGPALFPKLGVTLGVGAESVDHAVARTLAEEQPASRLLAAVRPELPMLVAPVTVSRSVEITGAAPDEVVLAFADGSPFVAAQSPSGSAGLVLVLASAPELAWSNLPVKPLMVPLFQELVRTSLQVSAHRDRVSVGERVRGMAGLRLRASDGTVMVVEKDGSTGEPVRVSGVLRGEDGTVIAVNHAARNLALAPLTEDAVRASLRGEGAVRFAKATAKVAGAGSGSEEARTEEPQRAASQSGRIAFVLLVAALAAMLVEGFLSRVFSHASLERAGRSTGFISTIGRVQARGTTQPRTPVRERAAAGGGR